MKNHINITYFLRGYRVSSKSYLTIPSDLHEIIIGNLLGDGHMGREKNYINSRFYFSQSIKNRIYIDHLYSLFEEYCGVGLRIKNITLKSHPGKVYQTIGFKTLSLPCFNYYRDLFYQFDGVKYRQIVPGDMYNLLTPKALAYWIMDDGSRASGGGVILCTESFVLKDINLLIEILTHKYKLNCHIQEFSYKKRIYITTKSREELVKLVKPYILPHFFYKLGI